MTEKTKTYCPACGSECDADGICMRKGCARRALQVRQKAAREAAQKAAEEAAAARKAAE